MLFLHKISFKLGKRLLLDQATLTVQAGTVTAIVGRNGAGKSTLFDLIAGRRKVDQGNIFLNNEEVTDQTCRERACWLGTLFQDPSRGSVACLTVRENLALVLAKGRRCRLRRLEGVSQLFPPDMMNIPMGNLSGGQRQIVAFQMAILGNPKVLLLDEPTAALDPAAAKALMELVTADAQQNNRIVLLITHDHRAAKVYADEIWELANGSIARWD